jgi:hypothetical protein
LHGAPGGTPVALLSVTVRRKPPTAPRHPFDRPRAGPTSADASAGITLQARAAFRAAVRADARTFLRGRRLDHGYPSVRVDSLERTADDALVASASIHLLHVRGPVHLLMERSRVPAFVAQFVQQPGEPVLSPLGWQEVRTREVVGGSRSRR